MISALIAHITIKDWRNSMSHIDTKKIVIQSPEKLSNTIFDCPAPLWAILYLIFVVIFFFTIFRSIM